MFLFAMHSFPTMLCLWFKPMVPNRGGAAPSGAICRV